MNHESSQKLPANTVWLFALAAAVLAVGSSFLTTKLPWHVAQGIYFGIFAVGGFLATYLTRSGTGRGVLAFLAGSAAVATLYFLVVAQAVDAATASATVLADDATRAEAAEASATMGTIMGGFVAAVSFLATAIAGIGGCVAGSRFKRSGGLAALVPQTTHPERP
jgi:hypothetical protein